MPQTPEKTRWPQSPAHTKYSINNWLARLSHILPAELLSLVHNLNLEFLSSLLKLTGSSNSRLLLLVHHLLLQPITSYLFKVEACPLRQIALPLLMVIMGPRGIAPIMIPVKSRRTLTLPA